MNNTRRVLSFTFLFALLAGCTSWSQPAETSETVIYLVRHAEKQKTSPDPALTTEGEARAAQLAELLASKNIQYIHSTNYKRTLQTAAPLATHSGLEVKLYDPRDLEGLKDRIVATGGTHLVVGHSNTTPQMVAVLGGEPGTPINEAAEYDRLYLVTLKSDGKVETSLLRFGTRYSPAE